MMHCAIACRSVLTWAHAVSEVEMLDMSPILVISPLVHVDPPTATAPITTALNVRSIYSKNTF